MIAVGRGALLRRLVEGTLLAAALSALGCASQREEQTAFAHLAPARSQPASAGDAGGAMAPAVGTTVVATVEGEPVSLRTLAPSLLEAAGGEVLQEHALDQALRAELARLGLRVGKEAVQRERALLLEQLATALERPADSFAAEEALAQLRQRRGLGPSRFAALLWRTAALRALTRQLDPVTVGPEAIEQAYDLAYGERRVARVITLPTLAQAQQVLEALAQGADFATLAATRSTDASAERGGLLEPITRRDPAYPPAIRQALFALQPGQWTSSPIAVDQGFAVLLLQRIEPAKDAPLEEVREQLVRSLTLQQERLRMDDLAQRLLQRARPVAVDEHLRWSLGALRAPTAPGAEGPR